MTAIRALLLGISLAAGVTAQAQYQWIDKQGRRVFSDSPPPTDLPTRNVLAWPRGAATGGAREAFNPAPAPSAMASAASATTPGVDQALQARKQQTEAEAAARKKADDDRLAAARADNCKRAMNAKAMLGSGQRMVQMNDKGEREVMTDEQRSAEQARVGKIIATDCR